MSGEWEHQPLSTHHSLRFFFTPGSERHTAICHLASGTYLPPHEHLSVEALLVLPEDGHVAPDGVRRAGDCFRASAGRRHGYLPQQTLQIRPLSRGGQSQIGQPDSQPMAA